MAEQKKVTKKAINLVDTMPHSIDAEKALLGCIIIDTTLQMEVVSFLHEEDFYAESNRYIFKVMADIVNQNKPVDIVTLIDELERQGTLNKAGGIDYIMSLQDVIPSSANYDRYMEIVRRDSTLRKLIKSSSEIIDNCVHSSDGKDSLAFAEKEIYKVAEEGDTTSTVKISSIIPKVIEKLDKLNTDKDAFRGIRTQYTELDKKINGLHPNDLMILAARPAVGKTSFAMNIVENVALQGYSCAVFSLEMNKEQLVQRMLCSVAEVSMENANKGQMTKQDWVNIAKARESLSKANIYIDESSIITPQEILSKCRRLKRQMGLDFVMIDYIQLMGTSSNRRDDNRTQQIGEISRGLKMLAMELNVPVLALSQLSRSVEKENRRPQLSDLRESGSIEQDADIVMFIHRPDLKATDKDFENNKVEKNVAEIIIAKHRSGPTGLIKLFFKGECTKFKNIIEEDVQPNNGNNVQGYEELPTQPKENDTDSEIF